MRGINGYTEAAATAFNELPKLEPGGYVLRILAVKVEETQWGVRLALQFDIAEGANKDFFKKLYAATPDEWEGKKWKGSYRMKIPQNEGDDTKYRKSVGFFKSQLEAFEKSNSGLHINAESDWDEQALKGRLVGALFNEKEWEKDGKSGFFTQCKRLVPAQDIRDGNYTIPKPDKLRENTQSTAPAATGLSDFAEIVDDGVPF